MFNWLFGKGRDRRISHRLAELERQFEEFRGTAIGITVRIIEAHQPDPVLSEVRLRLHPSQPPADHTKFLSIVKARLLVDMYLAANSAGLLIYEMEGIFQISMGDRSFSEPLYFLRVSGANVVPITFRFGEYEGDDITISLIRAIISIDSIMEARLLREQLIKLARGYLNGVREFTV
jgi:hypothetical protein